jgi:hypothetical protein
MRKERRSCEQEGIVQHIGRVQEDIGLVLVIHWYDESEKSWCCSGRGRPEGERPVNEVEREYARWQICVKSGKC